MISQTVEYALRAVVTIAQQDGVPCTARRISELTQVPLAYLSKLMQGLVRGGIVDSQRGLHGGFVLAKDPKELTILEIVQVVDPIRRIHHCPLTIESHGSTLCPLHRRLDQAIESTERILGEATVADMLTQPGSVTPLCEENKVVSLSGIETPSGGEASAKQTAKSKARRKKK